MKLRPSPSSSSSLPSKKKKKKQQCHLTKTSKGSVEGGSCSCSTSSSMEAPKGCLRFLLSSTSSSTSHQKARTNKAPISIPKTGPPLIAPLSGSGPIKGSASNSSLSGDKETPSKEPDPYGDTSGLGAEEPDINGRGMTPPIQPSVSPEVPCGSSIISAATHATAAAADDSATSPCYSAGHLLSGVSDKRKCRPRGLLIFEEPPPLFDDGTNQHCATGINEEDSGASTLSSPIQASMRWLLSPCREEGVDVSANSPDGVGCLLRLEEGTLHNSPPPDYSHARLPSDWCNLPVTASGSSAKRRQASTPPCGFIRQKAPPGPASFNYLVESPSEEDKMRSPNLNGEKSPVSVGSLSSGNVMQTPLSDSGSERPIDMPWLSGSGKIQDRGFDAELDALVGHLQMTHNSPVRLLDEASSSFQFDCFTGPSCSLDHSKFQKVLDDKACWFTPGSRIDTVPPPPPPQTGVRISWREGLASRMFEMEEFDCCRCFSEDEEECKDVNDVCTESHSCAPNLDANNKYASDRCEVVPCCAESISTDGGGLSRSDDSSDWDLCYKNHLFMD